MKQAKKFLSLVLAVIMLLSVAPMADLGIEASAAYENTASSYNYPLRKIADNGRGFSSSHKGIDFTVAKGTAVYAAKKGTVEIVYSGCKNYNGANSNGQDCKTKGCTQSMVYMSGSGYKAGYYCNNGFGNGVVVKNDDGKYCYYAHLNTVNVKKGDKVTPDTKLGEVGSSGCSTGAHLHFSMHSTATGGTAYNPFNYIFPGFKINITNNGSGSVNPRINIYFPWTEFTASKCKISFGTSSSSLSNTASDSDFTTNYCFYDLGKKFGNLTVGKTYYIKVSITKDGTTFNSSTYSFVAGAGNKTFLDYSTVAKSTVTVTFNSNGGSCTTTSKTVTCGSTYGTLPTPTRSGYTFNGWYTSASGGSKITSSTTVTATSNHTLYAQWTCAHSTTEVRNAKNATCTATGYTGDTYCTACGVKTITGTVISMKEHSEVADKGVSATCTATGLTEGKHCSVCGTVTVAQQTVAKKAHTEVIDKGMSATCIATGLTEGKHCSVCGTVIVAQSVVTATGHKDNNFDGKCDTCGISSTPDIPDTPDTPSDPTDDCSCNCHKGGIAGFFFKIINFFQKLFGMNKVCACGVAH